MDDKPHAASRRSHPSPERMLEWLPSMAKTMRSVEGDVAQRVARLRDEGVGWDRIAAALGVDETHAMARYGA